MKHSYQRTLTIAGSDSGGGAGIQADLKTFAALGCYGMSVITAVTAQNTEGVTAVHPVPAEVVAAQISAVLTDLGADAIKIGMLFTPEIVRMTADVLSRRAVPPIVLDPVMTAQSGAMLLKDEALAEMKTRLMPMAAILTPNLPEAEKLLGRTIRTVDDMQQAARELASFGSRAVLLKGGHLEEDQNVDFLYLVQEDRLLDFPGERIRTQNDHGTGCTLSAAIAAFLAKGRSMEQAVLGAKIYLTSALKAGAKYKIGHGRGPLHHFHKFW